MLYKGIIFTNFVNTKIIYLCNVQETVFTGLVRKVYESMIILIMIFLLIVMYVYMYFLNSYLLFISNICIFMFSKLVSEKT